MLLIIQVMCRAERGIGAFAIAVEGHWNSRTAGKVGSLGSGLRHGGTSALALTARIKAVRCGARSQAFDSKEGTRRMCCSSIGGC